MNISRSSWLPLAFIACFAIVGIPYWSIPNNRENLPDTLIGPGLIVVGALSMMLVFYIALAVVV